MNRGTERTRRGRRRRWMVRSAVPTALAVGLAATMLAHAWEVDRAADAYRTAQVDPAAAPGAVDAFTSLDWPVWFDDDVGPMGIGAASILAGDLAGARSAFETALAVTDGHRRCKAAVNVVLTIEAQGDEIVEIDTTVARTLYLEARGEIDEHPDCRRRRDPDGDGPGDRLDRAAARLDAKLTTATPPASDQRPVSPEQTEDDPDQRAIDELDRALDENADTRSQGPELEDGAEIEPGAPPTPQW